MDNYYKFPWNLEESYYIDGDKKLTIYSESGGTVANVYRQSKELREEDWKVIASIMTLTPELLAIVRALANNSYGPEYVDLAHSIIKAIDEEVKPNSTFWKEIDKLIEEV